MKNKMDGKSIHSVDLQDKYGMICANKESL